MKNKINLLSAVLLFFQLRNVPAQSLSTNTVASITPGGYFDKVADQEGRIYDLQNLIINPVGLTTNEFGASIASTCTAGMFVVHYATNSGIASTTNQFQINCRNTICEVLSNISGLLGYNSSTWPSTVSVHILIDDIGNFVTNPATSNFLGMATAFYAYPANPSSANPGILENQIQKTIQSKTDAWTNVSGLVSSSGGSNFYHGIMVFNFANTLFNWNSDINTTPGSNQFDFYTVVLHEVTHALGFASLISSSGASKLGVQNNYYSKYDVYLTDKNSSPLLLSTSNCSNQYNLSFNVNPSVLQPSCTCSNCYVTDVTTCSTACRYNSSNVSNIPVYTPNCYENASSLSHFEDMCYPTNNSSNNNAYFTMSNANGPGTLKRYLKHEEKDVLCDLGYTVTNIYSSNAVGASTIYSGSGCSLTNVWGINDGLSNGAYTYTSTTNTINIPITTSAGVLFNDSPNATTITCVQSVYNNGAASINNGSITFVASNSNYFGPVLIRYIPLNGNIQGNITYVYGYISRNNCNTVTMCDMVQNNSFENNNGCGSLSTQFNTLVVNCWNAYTADPDIFKRSCGSAVIASSLGSNTHSSTINGISAPFDSHNGIGNNSIVGLGGYCFTGQLASTESLEGVLSSPLVPGHAYNLSFWAFNFKGTKTEPNNPNGPLTTTYNSYSLPLIITLGTSNGFNTPFGSTYPNAFVNQVNSYTLSNQMNLWQQYNYTFTYTGTQLGNFIYLGLDQSKTLQQTINFVQSQNYYHVFYGLFDDISITEVDTTMHVTFPTCLYANQTLTNLAQYISVPNVSFSGPSVTTVNINGVQYNYNVNGNLSTGLNTISYSYTNNLNCVINKFHQFNVIPVDYTLSVLNSNYICAGQTATMSVIGNALDVLWAPNNYTNHTITHTSTNTTNYTVNIKNNVGCQVDLPLTINVSTNCCTPSLATAFVGSVIQPTFSNANIIAINNDVSVTSGIVTFSNNFIFAKDVRVIVEPGAKLIVKSAHMYACSNDMWGGIVIKDGAELGMQNESQDNLIEDAKVAIDAVNQSTTNSTNLLTISHTTFNKNRVDIDISNYQRSSQNYPFNINHCVFTCRALPFTQTSWPQTGTSNTGNSTNADLRYASTTATTGLSAPYLFYNFTPTVLLNPYSTEYSNIAIGLHSVGQSSTNTTYPIVIGDGTNGANFNLFDTHQYFINAYNSNINSYNNVFQNTIFQNNTAGAGIFGNWGYQLSGDGVNQNYKIRVLGSNGTQNKFYDCHTAIELNNVAWFEMKNTRISSAQTYSSVPSATMIGRYGVRSSGNHFIGHHIENNELVNIRNGIFTSMTGPLINPYNCSYSQGNGVTNLIGCVSGYSYCVYSNTISPVFNLGSSAANGENIDKAITIENLLSGGIQANYQGDVKVQYNILNKVWNGISIRGFNSTKMKVCANNSITLVQDATNTNAVQYGVNHSANKNSVINTNTVVGFGYSNSTQPVSGIYNSQNAGSATKCNSVATLPRGLEFANTNLAMQFRVNSIDICARGLMLSNTGSCVSCGMGTLGATNSPLDNYWIGGSSTWSAYAQTYVDAVSQATSSPMYVRLLSNLGLFPIYNISGGTFPQVYQYNSNNLSLSSLRPGTSETVMPCYTVAPQTTVVGRQRIEAVVVDTNFIEVDADGNEINKFLVFEELWGDSTLQNANDTLGDFFDDQGNHNLGIIHNAEHALAIRDLNTANNLINNLNTESNIEYCYKRFLQFSYNYLNDGALNESDRYSLEILAAQCPFTDGPSIYKARTLLNTIINDIIIYNDDGCKGTGYSNRIANNSPSQNANQLLEGLKLNEEQQSLKKNNKLSPTTPPLYKVFPNPSNGTINLKSSKNSETIDVSITDLSGRTLFLKTITTNVITNTISCDLKNGIYFICIKNSSNETFTSKIIIQK